MTHSEMVILRWIGAVFPFSSARCQPLKWLDSCWEWQDQMQLWRTVSTHCDRYGLVGLKELVSREQAETLLRFMWAHAFDFVCGGSVAVWKDVFGLVLALTECFPPIRQAASWSDIGTYMNFLFASVDPTTGALMCGGHHRGVTLFVLLRYFIREATECDRVAASATILRSMLDYGPECRVMMDLVEPLIRVCPEE